MFNVPAKSAPVSTWGGDQLVLRRGAPSGCALASVQLFTLAAKQTKFLRTFICRRMRQREVQIWTRSVDVGNPSPSSALKLTVDAVPQGPQISAADGQAGQWEPKWRLRWSVKRVGGVVAKIERLETRLPPSTHVGRMMWLRCPQKPDKYPRPSTRFQQTQSVQDWIYATITE
jgi:hypothetical protein